MKSMSYQHELASKIATQNAEQAAIVRHFVFTIGSGATAITPAHGKHHGQARAKGTSSATSASMDAMKAGAAALPLKDGRLHQ